MHEIIVLVTFYVISLAVYELHKFYKRHAARKAALKADADTLNVLSPLHVVEQPGHKRHLFAAVAAVVAHPATAESIHHYIIHFIVYSGQIIK